MSEPLKDTLEMLQYVMTIAVPIIGGFWFLLNIRKKKIEDTKKYITRNWSNEGCVDSDETLFINIKITDADGDLIGQLESNARERTLPLDVHLDVGLFKTTMYVSELFGRNLMPIAKVTLRITGNNNRLTWKLIGKSGSDILPSKTILWPS